MDVISGLGGIAAGFGLSGSAGLNAYIPLLIVALAARFPTANPILELGEPYNTLANSWVIGVLAVLLLIEMFVDKIPAVDTINDVIQTVIRPTAGAILFAANAGIVTDLSPVLAIIIGLILAGGVHAVKGVVRPAVTATTAGTGNWLVSLIEDVIAFVVSVLSILIPILSAIVFAILLYFFLSYLYRRNKRHNYVYRG
ncbi:MAG: DUF4126 domain-containing protein [Chloroflexi bacterium]|nr:DUF4126 domain-containing protein [Chloroflexota bacterium]MCI0580414.1 DUF4126 domain-containing protein [Chloroflexota bacterium]MCI0647288.1 DUF4126 domain-containing protein [Chloroflexota bacterium]MCI0729717.1 DUF4126 domain-containing protein [Chloroflexota bacterium]